MVQNDVLTAALLWLRNHYDTGTNLNPAMMKAQVLQRIDAVLGEAEPTIAGMERLREEFPIAGTPIVPRCKNDPFQVEMGMDGSCLKCGARSGETCR